MLGSVRCLARARIPCRVLSQAHRSSVDQSHVPHRRDPYANSRWYRPAPPYGGGGLATYLSSLPFDAILIPCSDDWARAITELPPELRQRFPSSLSAGAVLRRFLDKGLFAQLLEAEAVPHPDTVLVRDVADVHGRTLSGQSFIKPRDSQTFHARFGVKAFWPSSREGLLQKLELATGSGFEVILQEYIPGPASHHYFVDGFLDAHHRVRAVFARRRLRMYPPRFGNSSYMVSIPLDAAAPAVESITGLLTKLGYRGVFSAEFKKDDRDGLFKLLEVNARPWWFVEFAANCGVNVLEMAYRDALGEPVAMVHEYETGRYLIHPYFDISACLHDHPTRTKGLAEFFRALRGAERPIFRWNDPLPALAEFGALSRSFVRRRLGKALRR